MQPTCNTSSSVPRRQSTSRVFGDPNCFRVGHIAVAAREGFGQAGGVARRLHRRSEWTVPGAGAPTNAGRDAPPSFDEHYRECVVVVEGDACNSTSDSFKAKRRDASVGFQSGWTAALHCATTAGSCVFVNVFWSCSSMVPFGGVSRHAFGRRGFSVQMADRFRGSFADVRGAMLRCPRRVHRRTHGEPSLTACPVRRL